MQVVVPPTINRERFRVLQSQLRDRWQSIDNFDQGETDILVVPSLSLDQQELQKVKGIHHYEERLLFSLIRLRNPCTRLIYVTSQPIHPSVIEYYLQLLPGIPFSHARDRLLMLSVYDASTKPLTQKILERPRIIERIRRALRSSCSYITCFNSTELERQLSLQLDVPLLAVDPDLLAWGTKSGSRQVFAEAQVPHPDGSLQVWSVADLAIATVSLWERHPHLQRMVVKLNEGFSGQGNALLDLRPLYAIAPPHASTAERIEAITRHFHHLSFQCETETWPSFSRRIPELGAIVEAFLEGEAKRSPSVQCRITPIGKVEILSTHDQILGGPDGQIFLGCRFPADEAYRLQLQDYGYEVGKVLAEKGALERFSVDFLAIPQANGRWDIQAIEINLRKGGTTHPFMALKLLTGGRYDSATGQFYNQQGKAKYYIATDNLHKDRYRGLLPSDLMDIIARHGLHFNHNTETGTIFHLMGCLSEFGKLGLTSIGNSPQQAEDIYNQVIHALDEETQPFEERSHTFASFAPPLTWESSVLQA
ncbi:MAG TPA: carboxylate-amine ligase [Synechococcales cyanobacterium M55_K2018_004]|nr:carboxylate-amine ligase [Synechococcales cyanobacterium M55_K2018_004]